MKINRNLVLTLFLGLGIMGLQAQDKLGDHEQIITTLNYYLNGGTHNDFDTLKQAFHPSATMKSVSDKDFREVNALDFFRKGMSPGPKQDRKTEIISIDRTGNMAAAKLRIDYTGFTLYDHMQLMKIGDTWLIVSKMFTKEVH
ncbi:nuclear transport factor 2 family protein [Flagellimonas sp.]|jgi:hypothetical protein|uniref:nuclear transport factor 2 family protein n=1 Tax=Flagellimonas sp. TaxID=2058762 RepID=UPI003BAA7A04